MAISSSLRGLLGLGAVSLFLIAFLLVGAWGDQTLCLRS
jgi:hypothetical protein